MREKDLAIMEPSRISLTYNDPHYRQLLIGIGGQYSAVLCRELVGYVESIIPRKTTQKSEYMKFFLNNGKGRSIQCVIWGPESIDALEKLIVKNEILHIDGANSRVPAHPNFNKGNTKYELQLYSNTCVTSVGSYQMPVEAEFELPKMPLMDVIHYHSKKIIVSGYIKTLFVDKVVGTKENRAMYGSGSLTDGKVKLEVRISSFKSILKCQKGDPVNVTGTVKSEGARIFLQVNSEEDFELLEEPGLDIAQVINGFRELKRPNDEDLSEKNSKQKI